jgi:hypothetical protein
MRAKNFILDAQTYTGAGSSESFTVTVTNQQISATDTIGQFGLALSSSISYANENLYVLSRTVSAGSVVGTLEKSAASPGTTDSIDVITISAKG